MITVFNNADFISLDEHNITYSTMVVKGKEIVYMGYNTPICYDDAKVVDLGGRSVVPLINEVLDLNIPHANCKMLAAGQSADFAVLNKNILKEFTGVEVMEIYLKGKKRALQRASDNSISLARTIYI